MSWQKVCLMINLISLFNFDHLFILYLFFIIIVEYQIYVTVKIYATYLWGLGPSIGLLI